MEEKFENEDLIVIDGTVDTVMYENKDNGYLQEYNDVVYPRTFLGTSNEEQAHDDDNDSRRNVSYASVPRTGSPFGGQVNTDSL